jgi:hypothetical protein
LHEIAHQKHLMILFEILMIFKGGGEGQKKNSKLNNVNYSVDLPRVYGFKPCIFVRPNFFRYKKTHLGLNYICKKIFLGLNYT